MENTVDFERFMRNFFPAHRLLRTWSLKGGISAEMTALEIADENEGRQKWVVRQPGAAVQNPRRAVQDEFRLLQAAHELGLASPAPYRMDCSGEVSPGPFLVIGYAEGEPDFAPREPQDLAVQMAKELRRIHSADSSRIDLSFLPRFGDREHDRPRPLAAGAALADPRIAELLDAAWPFSQHNPPALLHGDYWPGNILWQNGRLAAVIDWEDAAIGDPLSDLAISRLDLLWIYGSEAMEAFSRTYLLGNAIDTRGLPYWDLYAANRLARLVGSDIDGWAAFFEPYGRTDITGQSIQDDYQYFVSQAFEQLGYFEE